MKLKIEYDNNLDLFRVYYLDKKTGMILKYYSPYKNLYELLSELLSEIDFEKEINYEIKR